MKRWLLTKARHEPSESALYRQAGPRVRQMLNRTIFTKLKVDGGRVTDDELAEPFDVLVGAGGAYERRSYQHKRPPSL